MKGKYGLQLFAFLLLAFLCLIIFQLIHFGIMIGSFGFSFEEVSKQSFIPTLMDTKKYWPLVISFLIQSVGLFVIPSLVFNWFANKSEIEFFTFKKKRFLKFAVLLPFLGLSGVIIVSFFGYLNMQLDLPEYFVDKENSTNETIKFILSFRDSPHILMNILLLAIIPAVGEELFFRGVLQKIFVSWTRKNVNPAKEFTVGDKVKAAVLTCDSETSKFCLGI
ncbi:MAG: type II CAAX prenyl endopeptidase Rce1 family protein, partial [Flavobacteriales bacterium]